MRIHLLSCVGMYKVGYLLKILHAARRENISNSAIIFSFFYRKLTISRRISYPINPSPLLLVVFMAYHFLFCS